MNAKKEDHDGRGVTPLHWAAGEGHNEIAELLIANGANVNSLNDEKRSNCICFHQRNL